MGAHLEWQADRDSALTRLRPGHGEPHQPAGGGGVVEPGPLQRTAMEPLRQLLRSQFRIASAQWEKEQQCAAAQALEQGKGGWQAGEYRTAIAAMGHLEARFVEQVHAEVTDGLFQRAAVQRRHHGALLDAPGAAGAHEQFLLRLFALLERPDAASIAHTPPCMMDVSGRRRCCVYTQASWATSSRANSHCWRHCSGLVSVASRLGTRPSAGS